MTTMTDPGGASSTCSTPVRPRADFDRLVEQQPERAGEYDIALRLRDLIARHRAREAELSALYETAHDLTAIRDLDEILTAIVRRARQLLGADMTYLSLNDEVEGASYMKVTDGALTREFKTLRLPLGTGLLGLVAQTGAPYFTEDYQADDRFVHRHYIDDAVAGERIRAILGVPLLVEGRVIGALLAVHRTVRRFPAEEVSLLMSFAAHASVALENARLFARLDEANRTISAHASSVEAAAMAHERMTDLLLAGGGVAEVVDVLAQVLGGDVAAWDPSGQLLAGTDVDDRDRIVEAARESARSGHAIEADLAWVAAAVAAGEHVATVVLHGRASGLDAVEQRTLERGALVTALVLVFARSVAEASERLGTQLLVDLVEGRELDPDRLRERARRHTFDPDADLVLATADHRRRPRHCGTRGRTPRRPAPRHLRRAPRRPARAGARRRRPGLRPRRARGAGRPRHRRSGGNHGRRRACGVRLRAPRRHRPARPGPHRRRGRRLVPRPGQPAARRRLARRGRPLRREHPGSGAGPRRAAGVRRCSRPSRRGSTRPARSPRLPRRCTCTPTR